MTTRSTQLSSGAVGAATGDALLYTVPSGYRALVKSTIATPTSSGTATLYLRVQTAGGDLYFFKQDVAQRAMFIVPNPIWFVLNAGDKVSFYRNTSTSLEGVISGALLPV